MKLSQFILFTFFLFLLICCDQKNKDIKEVLVSNQTTLNNAIKEAKPGTEIILKNGIWKNLEVNFYGKGTLKKPISLKAETPGKVFIEGQSYLALGGEHLIVDGLFFRNGYTPKNTIISYKINNDSTAFNTKVINCVIKNFTKPSRLTNDHWIEFYGRNNSLKHCYISGKSNDGETLRVYHTDNKNTNNHHQITHNYFGPRPRKGGPRGETIRVGDSKTNMTPGYVNVSNNFFEACNGEVEIISDKTNFNTFKNNIFYKCEGSLVLRHGSYATVDGNIFIGGDNSDFYGGIRVINTGHWITNNYFYKINGSSFRSPLAIMNGIPKSQLNRYKQVTDVVIAHNTWVDCKSPWQVGVGQNLKSIDVLPEVEIRSAPPIRSIVANNLIYNHDKDQSPIINHDKINGVSFKNNIISNQNFKFNQYGNLTHQNIEMTQLNDWLFVPKENQYNSLEDTYNGFDFKNIKKDLFGSSREERNTVGSVANFDSAKKFKIDKKLYGPSWFSVKKTAIQPNIYQVSSAKGELVSILNKAETGSIIELTDKNYTIENPLSINKEIIIRSADTINKAQLTYTGKPLTALFKMLPYGKLNLNNIDLKGTKTQMAFAPLDKNMSAAYHLHINKCSIDQFSHVLKASKGSFADEIKVKNTNIKNCENGIILAAEEKGDYNAEMVVFENCNFKNIQQNVIHFYRGGYDESTIGGVLTLSKNTFENCGKKEKSNLLIKTKGIVNVFITNNTFKNNPVEFSALLWGVKNNHHKNNTFSKSGIIKIEEQQKLDILY